MDPRPSGPFLPYSRRGCMRRENLVSHSKHLSSLTKASTYFYFQLRSQTDLCNICKAMPEVTFDLIINSRISVNLIL